MLNEATQFAIAAWLATYLLHGTVLLATVWALSGLLRRRQEALLEMLWRFALIAPVLSASLQTGLSVDPLAGALPVADRAGFRAAAANDPAAWLEAPAMTEGTHAGGARPAIAIDEAGDLHPDGDRDRLPSADHPAAAATDDAYGQQAGARDNDGPRPTRSGIAILRSIPGPERLQRAVVAVIGAAMLVFAACSIAGWVRLRALMRGRTDVVDGPLPEMLRRLQRRSAMRRRVRLTASAHLAAPIAFGVLRPEICVPAAVRDRLGPSEQESMLAHELAHHVRRDPAWLAVAHLLERLFFFQPLNGVACRRLRNLAELHCDAWAAEQTGDRITLARCLTEVASWILQQRAEPALVRVMGMAGSPSALRQRIVRLLDDASPSPSRARRVRRSFIVLGPLLLAVMIWVVPGVGAPARRAEPAEGDPSSAPAERASGDVRSLGEQGAALLEDLAVLDAEIIRLRETADRLPPELQWADLMDDLTFRAQTLRRRGEGMVDAFAGAPDDVAHEQTDDDELDY